MSHLFRNIEGVEVIVDDLVVWEGDVEQHDARLRHVLDRCRECNLTLNQEKCRCRVSEVGYVGHVLSSDGIKPDLQKVEAINAMPIPVNHEELQRFLHKVVMNGWRGPKKKQQRKLGLTGTTEMRLVATRD